MLAVVLLGTIFLPHRFRKKFHRELTSLQTNAEKNFFSINRVKEVFKSKLQKISISSGEFSIFMLMPDEKCKCGVLKRITVHMLHYHLHHYRRFV